MTNNFSKQILSEKIKNFAMQEGFVDCGIAKPHLSEYVKSRFENWIDKKYHATMDFMSRTVNIRSNPFMFFSDVKSIVVVLACYNFGEVETKSKYKIARFAQGNDYHFIIKQRLNNFFDFIKIYCPDCKGIATVDSMSVAERYWATQAGLGFIGQNNMLIHNKYGSWVLIGTLFLDIELEYDKPNNDSCLKCGKCIKSCPGNALSPYCLDANKCITYHTIENRVCHTGKKRLDFKNQIFGCDICNQVCPHNQSVLISKDLQFKPNPQLLNMTDNDWLLLGNSQFRKYFSKSPLKRMNIKDIRRNIGNVEYFLEE